MKHKYWSLLFVVALAVGTAFAQSTDGQKNKNKEKMKAEEKYKADKFERKSLSDSYLLPLRGGEGSYLGVFLEEVTAERMKELGLNEERGAIVMKVVDGSPAEKAGLKENDVIVAFNGRQVESVRELQRMLGDIPAGRNVTVDVRRGGAQQTISATLGKRESDLGYFRGGFNLDPDAMKRYQEALKDLEKNHKLTEEELKKLQESFGVEKGFGNFGNFNFVFPGLRGSFRGTRIGITAEPLTPQLAEYFGAKSGGGVLVTEVHADWPAAKAGLKAGDVITAIDNRKVDNIDTLITALMEKGEGTITLNIIRDRSPQTINVTIEKRGVERPAPRAPRRRAGLSA
jgi:S1-C subfamily serine protease